MRKCEHDTSETLIKTTTDGLAVHICAWDCQRHFVTYEDANGITHELSQEANAALRAELDAVKEQNERMTGILLQITDPDEMMNGMSQALSWHVLYAMENPEARRRYGRQEASEL